MSFYKYNLNDILLLIQLFDLKGSIPYEDDAITFEYTEDRSGYAVASDGKTSYVGINYVAIASCKVKIYNNSTGHSIIRGLELAQRTSQNLPITVVAKDLAQTVNLHTITNGVIKTVGNIATYGKNLNPSITTFEITGIYRGV